MSATQVEAISRTVMAQILGMLEHFQAQMSDLTAMVSIDRSSLPRPVASYTITSVTVVRPGPRLEASSVKTGLHDQAPADRCREKMRSGEDLSSGPESTAR